VFESLIPLLIESPLGQRFLKSKGRKAIDADHFTDRYQSFFLIIVGEGVFLIIKNGPLGYGVTDRYGAGANALIIYYLLAMIYFNGDQSKRYIHSIKRTRVSLVL